MLVETLSTAVHELELLTEKEQNQIASLLNEEIGWLNSFKKSQGLLSVLANEAIVEHRSNKTMPIICE